MREPKPFRIVMLGFVHESRESITPVLGDWKHRSEKNEFFIFSLPGVHSRPRAATLNTCRLLATSGCADKVIPHVREQGTLHPPSDSGAAAPRLSQREV